MGNNAVVLLVFFQVAVQQVEFYVACTCLPDMQKNLSIRKININEQRFAFLVNALGYRKLVKVRRSVV